MLAKKTNWWDNFSKKKRQYPCAFSTDMDHAHMGQEILSRLTNNKWKFRFLMAEGIYRDYNNWKMK